MSRKPLKVLVDDFVNFQVEGLTPQDIRSIRKQTSLPVKGAFTTAAFKAKIWDGRESLFTEEGVGVLSELEKVLGVIEDLGYDLDDDVDYDFKQPDIDLDVPFIDENFVKEYSGYAYRDYQMNSVNAAIAKRKGILDIGTNGGKTWICVGISKAFDPVLKSVVIVPSENLVNQTYADYKKTDLNVVALTKSVKPEKREALVKSARHVILTTKLFLNCYEYFAKDHWVVMIDECFHPSHELLTTRGWKPIAEVTESDEVMAYDQMTGKCRFEKVSRTVKNYFNGDLLHLKSNNSVDLLVTPNHLQPFQSTRNGKKNKTQMKNLKKGHIIPISSFFDGHPEDLSSMEKLKIAFEADGHLMRMNTNGEYVYRFAFRRDRKINRLENILGECGIQYRKAVNGRGDTNITFKMFECMQKTLQWFNPYVSPEKNFQFIKELGHWDGCFIKEDRGIVEWECGNYEEVMFTNTVAKMAGYQTSVTELKGRNKDLSSVYRIRCRPDSFCKLTKTSPIPVKYEGNVYCVTVPSGNLLTRRGSVISISGNCHNFGDVFSDIIRCDMAHCPVRIGLTATLPKKDNDPYKRHCITSIIGGGILEQVKQEELISRGISSAMKIRVVSTSDYEMEELSEAKEFDWSVEESYLRTNINRVEAIADYIKSFDTKNTLILCHAAFAIRLGEILGYPVIVDETPTAQREKWFAQFDDRDDMTLIATFGCAGTGISINRIFREFMIDVGKNETYILQGIGRGLRLDGVHNSIELIDIHARTKYSMRHLKDRLKIYKNESFDYSQEKEFIMVSR